MVEDKKATKKPTPPKGGRKGGTTFPRVALQQALEYSDKLVSKTHTGPQPESTILAGVFGNAGPEGQVRASALKQYGLLTGNKNAYEAADLAKSIGAAPSEEKIPLLRQAFLNAKLFKEIFDTFHGDSVTKAKIRQRALALKVHPDSADECVTLFIDSAEAAGLGTRDTEGVKLVHADETAAPAAGKAETSVESDEPTGKATVQLEPEGPADDSAANENSTSAETVEAAARPNRAGVTVNLNVDSSSDPDKLQKQLELLRRFGVI
jgi:hypothetical protein